LLPDEPLWVYALRIATPGLLVAAIMTFTLTLPLMLMGKYVQSNQSNQQQQVNLARQVH